MTWEQKINEALGIGVSVVNLDYEIRISKQEAKDLVNYLIEEKDAVPDLTVQFFADRYVRIDVKQFQRL